MNHKIPYNQEHGNDMGNETQSDKYWVMKFYQILASSRK